MNDRILTIERPILEKNDEVALANRHWFQERGLTVLNLLSSPGSGKTTILEQILPRLHGRLSVAVIEGDVQTDLDARRVAKLNVPVAQIVTRGGCHLDARLVQQTLQQMTLDQTQLLIIENVGNLVCPANYDLGETFKVVVLSTAEGADKPLKYPTMFRQAAVLLINKIDLLPYVDCDLDELKRHALAINPALRIFELSAKTGAGLDPLCEWLIGRCGTGA
ncbi:MAG: hydrogenase nickel incorporation protein HypB [Planctomycetota bacterium]